MNDIRKVILVTERDINRREGCGQRIIQMIKHLTEKNIEISAIVRNSADIQDARPYLSRTCRVDAIKWDYHSHKSLSEYWIKPWLKAVHSAVSLDSDIDAVMCEYIWMAPCLDVVHEKIVTIIDAHDLMHGRQKFLDEGMYPWIICSKQEESNMLSKADVVIAIQKDEAKIFKEMVSSTKVITAGHSIGDIKKVEDSDDNNVLIIGSNNPYCIHGLNEFIDNSWTEIREKCHANLLVYGDVSSRQFEGDGVRMMGFIEDIDAAYRSAKVVINPIRYGSGLKIKTVEALSKGKALVTTECGASGIMKGRDEAFMVGNFSKNIIDLMKNDKIHKDLCKGALRFARQNFSKDQAYGELIKEIKRTRR